MVRRIGFPGNSPYLVRDIDGVFTYHGILRELVPPVIDDFTWFNQGSSVINDDYVAAWVTCAAGSNPNVRGLVKAQPAKPYKIDVLCAYQSGAVGSQFGGVCWRDSAGGGLVVAQVNNNSTIVIQKYTSPTALSANYASVALSNYAQVSVPVFIRLEDNNTSRIVSVSVDGKHWQAIHTIGNTDFITANQVGFVANPSTGSVGTNLWLTHWRES